MLFEQDVDVEKFPKIIRNLLMHFLMKTKKGATTMANESKSCERCIYSRPIISENGIHSICTFSSKKATKCMVENRIFFKENISLNHDKKWFGEGADNG
jgi:hypothetical protein